MKTTLLLLVSLSSFGLFAQTYTESSISLGVTHEYIDSNLMGGGAAFFDFNNDGWEDLYITGGDNRDQLFQNDQTGNFTEIGISAGLGFTSTVKTNGVIAGDIDNDGFKDLFVTTSQYHNNLLLLNNGDNTFSEISIAAGITDSVWSMSASFGDFNRDGYLDIYCGNYARYLNMPFYTSIYSGITNNLYLNNGNNTFTDVSAAYNMINTGSALAITSTDYDNDSDMDVIVANDFGSLYGGNSLYRNDFPNTTFSNISIPSGINEEISAMGIAIGDYDEDLDLDYYITNMMENVHHVNNFDQTFTDDATNAGIEATNVVSWGTFYFDYNNNTYLDLFVANGSIMGPALPQPNVLFQNDQNGSFTDISLAGGIEDTLRSRGTIYGDIDNDGTLEILVVNTDSLMASGKNVSLYKRNPAMSYIKIKLEGTASNRDGFGSHVVMYSNGRSWIREIDGGSSYLSHNSSIAHFGLGGYPNVDSVVVTWPTGESQTLSNPVINQEHLIVEVNSAGINEIDHSDVILYPNPAKDHLTISMEITSGLNEYKIYSFDGNLVQEGNLKSTPVQTIELSGIGCGIYNIQLIGDNAIVSNKISILK